MHPDLGIERRASVRYRLRLPVVFHWNDGVEHMEGGFTRDIAIKGALILSSNCPPIGQEVRIEVLLSLPDQLDIELRIPCVGKVTRHLQEANRSGFGVEGTFDDGHLARQRPLLGRVKEPASMKIVAKQ